VAIGLVGLLAVKLSYGRMPQRRSQMSAEKVRLKESKVKRK